MNAPSAAGPRGPVLAMPTQGRGWGLLAGFFVLSFLAHAVAFYLLQAASPAPAAVTPPPEDLSLLDLSNPANDGLRRWIEAQDPALLYASRESVPKALLVFPYKPSYAGMRSPQQSAPEENSPAVAPPARDPIAVISGAAAPAPVSEGAPAAVPSSVRFSGPLAARGPKALPGLSTEGAAILEPARFLIGVTGGGEVRFAFLQRSSGDKAVDDEAGTLLLAMHFAPGSAPLAWGVASFFWGNDAYGGKGAAGGEKR